MGTQTKRTVGITTWGGGVGTFWQEGDTIGVVWKQVPDWGSEVGISYQQRSWRLGSKAIAQRYFDTMARNF